MKKKIAIYLILVLSTYVFYKRGRSIWYPVILKIKGKRNVEQAVNQFRKAFQERLLVEFEKNEIKYPPEKLLYLAVKQDKIFEVWAKNKEKYELIKSYSIVANSGKLGPKLKEGDFQIPEGIYRIIGLNPNSSYHVSMKLSYPNEFDLQNAKEENRKNPGSNIFIHGKDVSIGCIALGDKAIEELFVLTNDVGKENIEVIISPTDPRKGELLYKEKYPKWVKKLYKEISERVKYLLD